MATWRTAPLWRSFEQTRFPRLEQSGHFDVVIVGGGMTGLMAAYFAVAAGKNVCVLERDRIAQGDSGHTTAHLTGLMDERLRQLVKRFGESGASLAWFAGFYAIEAIAKIVEDEDIACDFQRVDGYLHESLIGKGDDAQELREEVECAQQLGFEVDFVDSAPIVHKPALRLRNQAIFHPTKFLAGLAGAIIRRGGRIFEHSEVKTVEHEPIEVQVNNVKVTCDQIVIATHVPIIGKASLASATLFQTKLIPRSSYVISGTLPAKSLQPVSLWDTSDPYFYLRIDALPTYDRVIFGGMDHKTGQIADTKRLFTELENTLRRFIPQVSLDHRWSGQIIETTDGLPYIGEFTKGQFIATGFNGNGITFGAIAGIMLHDHLLGRENPWKDLFAVDRSALRGDLWEYIKSNFDYPYYMAADRLKLPTKPNREPSRNGEGCVISSNVDKIACAKDRHGKIHRVSAVCPHLGCIVHWNNAEQTWDCPCHGSRFQPSGEVISGPAETPLANRAVETASSSA
jgi:glycine/D-amino acid oxidase-like deaminating enzyme/nitrite reductase/ring-hydroxylating ferredoxin subunit